jgi:hypothetical protein
MRRIAASLLLLGGFLGALLWLLLRPPAPLAIPLPGLALSDVALVEPGQDRQEHRSLRVVGARIEAIEPARADPGDPYAGATVLPGFADLHVHFPPPALPGQSELFAFLLLYHGVTSVRIAGDSIEGSTQAVREGLALGTFPGPRIVSCGPFVDGDPPLWPNSIVVRDPDEARAAVRRIREAGYECLKAYDGLDAESMVALREAAHEAGLSVIGHVPRRVPFEVALLDDAQHLRGVHPRHSDLDAPYPGFLAAWLSLDEARLDFVTAVSLEHDLAHTPTLVALDRLVRMQDWDGLRAEPAAGLLPRFYFDALWSPEMGLNPSRRMRPEDFEMVTAALEQMKRTVGHLHRAGVRLHTGTDTLAPGIVPGASLHRELELLVDAGLSPEAALAATRESAAFLGVEGLGSLRPGAPADLLVFGRDPTRDLANLDSLRAVVRDGRVYRREDLDAQLERYRDHFQSAVYDAAGTAVVRAVLARLRRGPAPAAISPESD